MLMPPQIRGFVDGMRSLCVALDDAFRKRASTWLQEAQHDDEILGLEMARGLVCRGAAHGSRTASAP